MTVSHLSLAGHGDYAYQQSSYTEQSYDRSFEDSTQHYYEGGKEHGGDPCCAPVCKHSTGTAVGTTLPELAVLASGESHPVTDGKRQASVDG